VLPALLLSAALAAAPYSLPYQLRPTLAADVLRLDTSFAPHEGGALTTASLLFASARLSPSAALYLRAALVRDEAPGLPTAWALGNPVLGVTAVHPLGGALRLAGAFTLALPLGMGGGPSPEPSAARAIRAGVPARAGLDTSLFGVNGVTATLGGDVSWISGGWTVQAEATLIQFIRTRGPGSDPDAARTNSTAGLHAAAFVAPWLSLGAEVRLQRYLGAPRLVATDASAQDLLSLAVGTRFHLPLGSHFLRPALTVARPLDEPLAGRGFTWVQLDLPFVF
jgi:hypothetical protein